MQVFQIVWLVILWIQIVLRVTLRLRLFLSIICVFLVRVINTLILVQVVVFHVLMDAKLVPVWLYVLPVILILKWYWQIIFVSYVWLVLISLLLLFVLLAPQTALLVLVLLNVKLVTHIITIISKLTNAQNATNQEHSSKLLLNNVCAVFLDVYLAQMPLLAVYVILRWKWCFRAMSAFTVHKELIFNLRNVSLVQ